MKAIGAEQNPEVAGIVAAKESYMNRRAATQLATIAQALDFTWKKLLVLTVLGLALGMALALVLPLRVA